MALKDKLYKNIKRAFLGLVASSFLTGCPYPEMKPSYKLERDGHYPGIVVFTYEENPLSDVLVIQKFNELKNGHIVLEYPSEEPPISPMGISPVNREIDIDKEPVTYDIYSVGNWYKKEANKYNQDIEIPLTLFKEQIKVPTKFIKYEDDMQSIDLLKFSNYLRDTYKGMSNYDFISVIHHGERDVFSGGYAYKNDASFLVENLTGYSLLNKVYAHEFAHLLGAKDYEEGISEENSIMNSYGRKLLEEIVITDKTASEIGWKK